MTTDLREKIAEVLAGHRAVVWPDGMYSCRAEGCTFREPWAGVEESDAGHRRHVAEAILAAIGDVREELGAVTVPGVWAEATHRRTVIESAWLPVDTEDPRRALTEEAP